MTPLITMLTAMRRRRKKKEAMPWEYLWTRQHAEPRD
jgi:hypothetical protein